MKHRLMAFLLLALFFSFVFYPFISGGVTTLSVDTSLNFVQKGVATEQNMDANLLADTSNGAVKLVPDQNMVLVGNDPNFVGCMKTVDQNVYFGFC